MAIELCQMPFYNGNMQTATVPITIDKAGRVVIPKSVRDELRLEPGDSLELACAGDTVTLRPIRTNAPLRKERGIWVYHGAPITGEETEKMIDDSRSPQN